MIRLLYNFSFNVELQIAKYQAPGRYILKPGVDLESLNKPQTESGRYLLFLYITILWYTSTASASLLWIPSCI